MRQIKLCRDGILRIRDVAFDNKENKRYTYDIPIEHMEDVDKNVFLKCTRRSFIIEDNLTLKELFKNLKPYSDLLEGLAIMDFDAFYDEVNQIPSDMKSRSEYKEIRLGFYVEFSPKPDFEDCKKLLDSKPVITDDYQYSFIHDSHIVTFKYEYDNIAGFYNNKYSLFGLRLNDISHVPVRVDNKLGVFEITHDYSHLNTSEPLFNPNNPLIKKEYRGDEVVRQSFEIEYEPTFMEAIVDNLLYELGFSYSPQQRDGTMEQIKDSIEELEEKFNNDEIELSNESDDVIENIEDTISDKLISEDEKADAVKLEFLETLHQKDSRVHKNFDGEF